MGKTDKRVDQYIASSEDFAIPILIHIREMVHACCPDVEETIKWGFPHFNYTGNILCSMASFKGHCAFGFWLGPVMEDTHGLFKTKGDEKAMGQWGRLLSLNDLPADEILAAYILQAMSLTENGIKLPKRAPSEKRELLLPDYFQDALMRDAKVAGNFNAMSYSHRKEYVEWITEAKTEVTRLKRIDTALEWIGKGKGRNWKYSK